MITVLRLGHRRERDKRLSTHVGLTARAFGASGVVYSGEEDGRLLSSVRRVAGDWGGEFGVSYDKSWLKRIKEFKGLKVHLTMYGLPLQDVVSDVRKHEDLLVVVGGEKVPGEVYHECDYNVAVTGQPHSEVAALAVFLHEYYRGNELGFTFPGAHKVVEPMPEGKSLIEKRVKY